jgi:hypothetical protein
MLNSLNAFFGERRAVGFNMGELGGLAKNNFAMLVRRELVLGGHGMFVPGADIVDINNECKHDRAPLVTPETGGGGCLVLVKFGKAVSEDVVSKDACLGESVHAMAKSRPRSHRQAC